MTMTLEDVPVKLNELDLRAPREVFDAIDSAIRERDELRAQRDSAREMHAKRDDEAQFWRASAERAEAERDALRKRIDESRHVTIGSYPAHGFGYVQMICDPAKGISDKVYALVPLDDAEAAP